jgi:plasmid stabilization system protein ParE
VSVAVRLTERAVADLAQAFQWYEEQKPDLGYRFMARVDEALDRISENPTLFAPQIKDSRRVLVEQFLVQSFGRRCGDCVPEYASLSEPCQGTSQA